MIHITISARHDDEISQREYSEDTAFWSLKAAQQFAARRRTLQIFFAEPGAANQTSYRWIDNTPQLWSELREVLESHNPSSIAINADADVNFGSGLHAGELMELNKQLGSPWKDKFVSKPLVAVEYIATMQKAQLPWYRKMQETAWAMIADGFSERVITPGKTTTDDVEWWLREKIQAMNYTTWFHPSVTVLGNGTFDIGPDPGKKPAPIAFGDVLHVDFGITGLGLNTDTQHMAYVLPPGHGSDDIPVGYQNGLRVGNRLQDIVKSQLKPGRTGNEILQHVLYMMESEGIDGQIYSHPIGDFGHSAGTLVGMSNLPTGVPVLGDLPLLKDMYYSIELFAELFVPERNSTMRFFMEEDVYWDAETEAFEWVFGRQEEFHLINASPKPQRLVVQA